MVLRVCQIEVTDIFQAKETHYRILLYGANNSVYIMRFCSYGVDHWCGHIIFMFLSILEL